MTYPNESKLRQLVDQLLLYGRRQHEYGVQGIEELLTQAES